MARPKGKYPEIPGQENRHHQATQRQINWRRFGFSVLSLLPSVFLFALTLGFCLAGIKISHTDQDYGCHPLRNVWVTNENKPNLWGHSYGLAITLGFGKLSYSSAKAIDVAWDLVIGRGAQVLCGAVIYWVFRESVTNATQHYAVPYKKVLKMQYNTASFSSLVAYTKDIKWSKRPARQYYTALMLAIATLYVLVLPMWLSAMSGYQAIELPLFRLQNNTFVPFGELTNCVFVISDGYRIGMGNDTCVTDGNATGNSLAQQLRDCSFPSPEFLKLI
jgi:hypothetical protein